MLLDDAWGRFLCDHFVTPEHRLGNLMDVSLVKMVNSPQQRRFGQAKRDSLPAYCRACDVRFACNGGCPKNRFALTTEGDPGLNYLCAGYKHFFHHIAPVRQRMTAALRARKPAASVVPQLRAGADKLVGNRCLVGRQRMVGFQQHSAHPRRGRFLRQLDVVHTAWANVGRSVACISTPVRAATCSISR